jgi:hypothetical protein
MDAALRHCTRLTDIRKGESDNINKAKQYKNNYFLKNIFNIHEQT